MIWWYNDIMIWWYDDSPRAILKIKNKNRFFIFSGYSSLGTVLGPGELEQAIRAMRKPDRQVQMKTYVRPVRRIGTEIRSGPVRSGLRSSVSDRSRTDLGPDRFDEIFFDGAKIFWKLDRRVVAIHFVQELSKSEPSSRFLSRSTFWKFTCHILANSANRPGIYIEIPYKSNFPRDV